MAGWPTTNDVAAMNQHLCDKLVALAREANSVGGMRKHDIARQFQYVLACVSQDALPS